MKPKRPTKSKALQPAKPGFDGLLHDLREFIAESRQQVFRAVDVVQVRTYWGVGRHIVEFEQSDNEPHSKSLPSFRFVCLFMKVGIIQT